MISQTLRNLQNRKILKVGAKKSQEVPEKFRQIPILEVRFQLDIRKSPKEELSWTLKTFPTRCQKYAKKNCKILISGGIFREKIGNSLNSGEKIRENLIFRKMFPNRNRKSRKKMCLFWIFQLLDNYSQRHNLKKIEHFCTKSEIFTAYAGVTHMNFKFAYALLC